MKKLLTLPITLLACASLLISCGGKKEDKKSEPSSEQQSSEPEPGPGPSPEPEGGIIFPDNLEDACFIDMGKLSYDAPDKEFEEHASVPVDPVEAKFNHAKQIEAYYEYNPEGEFVFIEEDYEEFQVYNDGICTYLEGEVDHYIYEDFGSVKSYEYEDTYTYIDNGENMIYKEDSFGYGEWHEWGTSNYTFDEYIEDTYDYCLNRIYLPGQPAYTKIGDFYYAVALDLDVSSSSSTAPDGSTFYYAANEKTEIIIKISPDFLVDEIYSYYQVTFDHDPYSGRFLNEPLVMYKSLMLLELDYGEYLDHPEAQKLLNNVPTQYFSEASLNYRVAAVNLDEDGELTAAPVFPENYSTATENFFDGEETAGLLFAPYYSYSNYFAIDLGLMRISYRAVPGGDINQVEVDPHDEALFDDIVEAMGAELKEYDGTTYLVVGPDYNYIEFMFSALGIEGSSDVTVQKATHNFMLI